MQLFYLSRNLKKNARYHCDKHVPKLVVEAAQQASTAFSIVDQEAAAKAVSEGKAYKPAYHKHPCVLWAAESRDNLVWVIMYGLSLCDEFERRFSGNEHKTKQVLQDLLTVIPDASKFPQTGITKRPQAFDAEYKNEDTVKGYRRYYLEEKMRFAVWKKDGEPKWVQEERVSDSEN